MQENDFWLDLLDDYYSKGVDRYTRYKALLAAMTPEKIQAFAKKLLLQGNRIELVMLPEKTTGRRKGE